MSPGFPGVVRASYECYCHCLLLSVTVCVCVCVHLMKLLDNCLAGGVLALSIWCPPSGK